jgi:D-alanine-D-alanine ligase-like ATP-grasp enzyme
VSQGATAEIIRPDSLPPSLMQDTSRIAKHFRRQLCGIDFMKNSQTGEYIFLEINTTPQIVNGVFVEEKAAALARALMR